MQPLADVDVLDLTQSVAGPVCTQRLAMLGANVVKVEPPDGDPFREVQEGTMFSAFNRAGKRSIAADIKSEAGREVVRDLAERADAVVESFRPGTLDRFDLGYESVSEANPAVVYCSITGFGQDGPYADRAVYDPVAQAASGVMSVTGFPDRPPVRIGTIPVDISTGANAAFMTIAALWEARETGEGTHVDASMFEVAASWMTHWVMHYDQSGDLPTRGGTGVEGNALNDAFAAAGGERFYMCAFTDWLFERVCRAIDREDLLEDDRYATEDDRWEHRESLLAEVEPTFREYDREDLLDRLAEYGVPSGPIHDVASLLEDPHANERDVFRPVYNRYVDAETRTIRLPLRTSEGPLDAGHRTPERGEHTAAVLEELGYPEERIADLVEDRVVR